MRNQKHGGLMMLLLMKMFRSNPCLAKLSSCIDLVFVNKLDLVVCSGVHSTLHPNCHHQTTYFKLNLFIKYPPSYMNVRYRIIKMLILIQSKYHLTKSTGIHYSKIKMSMNKLQYLIISYWIFSETFGPNDILTFDDRNPSWITENGHLG